MKKRAEMMERVIDSFEGISLEEMDGVTLMNRTDRKYWFNAIDLAALLEEIKDDYYILDIKGERNQPYITTYYDTPTDEMYNNHHRGKRNRFKIRRREYLSTGSSFLEVKFKSNKGRTIKRRIVSPYDRASFDEQDCSFISERSPYQGQTLRKVLENGFYRLMLVAKSMDERCTIDSGLRFSDCGSTLKLNDLIIVEVKSQGRSASAIINALNRRRIKSSGFSKYCIGRSLTDSSVKINRFKSSHRALFKCIKDIVINPKQII